MSINIALYDSQKETLNIIRKQLRGIADRLHFAIETFCYIDENQVVEVLSNRKEQFDVLLLDIDLPGNLRFGVAEKIRNIGLDISLIFVSSHDQDVFEALDYNPFGFIRKRKMEDELEGVLKRIYQKVKREQAKSMIIKIEDGEFRLNHTDIIYFEMNERRLTVCTRDRQQRRIVGRKSMKNVYEELDDKDFVLINSGCIANIKYIRGYSGNDILLDDGSKLSVSRSRMKDVKTAVTQYWGDRV